MPSARKRFTLSRLGQLLVRCYQVCISPLFPPCCRFYPSCSQYAIEAIRRFGLFKGSYLAGLRVLRCHPFCKGGVELVPEEFTWRPWREHAKPQAEGEFVSAR